MAKDRRSKDQKRKAKLAQRAKRHATDDPLPYEGSKYRADAWIPHVLQTESAVYEAILLSSRSLTNAQVKSAYVELINELRQHPFALLPPDEPEQPFLPGNEIAFLKWNIRRHWGLLFEEKGPVAVQDLIGILRSLLYSIEAQAWSRGASRGYVDFLYHFLSPIIGL